MNSKKTIKLTLRILSDIVFAIVMVTTAYYVMSVGLLYGLKALFAGALIFGGLAILGWEKEE